MMFAGIRLRLKSYLFRIRHLRGADIGSRCAFDGTVIIRGPEHIAFGDGCAFGPRCRIEAWDSRPGTDEDFNPMIVFGKNVSITASCHIGAINSVEIGDNALIGTGVVIIDHGHGRVCAEEVGIPPIDRTLHSKGPVKVGRNVWIGEYAVILPGVTVGDEAVIGACSVVTHDVPQRAVVGGNPARVLKVL